VVMVALPITLIPFVVYSRKVRKSSNAMYGQFADMGQLLHESFTGYRIVKAYNLEAKIAEDYRTSSRRAVSFFMRMLRSAELPGPLIEFVAAIGVSCFFLYLAFFSPQSTPGDLLQFVGCIFLMYQPIKNLIRLQTQLHQASAASQFIYDLLETKTTVAEPEKPLPLRAEGKAVQFEGVSFNYGEKPVVQDITLTVAPGQLVALVGSSGAGKTTLTNLLLRFYDPTKGRLCIGDTDIREVTTADLRRQIAVVTQETILFNETIRRNIELGRPGANPAQIEAAARAAHAHEFIVQKPQGYETVIGERGVALSGGQRQRIAIARAILKGAPILILDEATSALDTESERTVQSALEELMVGRTTICIAHRLSTIQRADMIVVLDQGRIVEQGTHAKLLKQGGVYRRLYELQFQS
jgi:ATP-binding cassette, subfamily B, bacterial MsbA